jgi:putative FmdB family regulatory protein
MPTYEYRCLKCKRKFEKLQSMTEPPVSKCPRCGGKPERLIGAGAGLIFKGSGFYITDYKKPKTPSSDKAAAPKEKKDAPAKPKKDD